MVVAVTAPQEVLNYAPCSVELILAAAAEAAALHCAATVSTAVAAVPMVVAAAAGPNAVFLQNSFLLLL